MRREISSSIKTRKGSKTPITLNNKILFLDIGAALGDELFFFDLYITSLDKPITG